MKKKMRKKQIINYFRFVAVGILFLLIVAFVSGCGSQTQDDSSSSEQKKVLSQSEIQKMNDLVLTDIEDYSLYEEEDEADVEGIRFVGQINLRSWKTEEAYAGSTCLFSCWIF